jgi:nicotinate phosphoribosyltransferase
MNRLHYNTFNFPITEIRLGYYSAAYFWRMKKILEQSNNEKNATMQIFNKVDNAIVCGTDEVLALLRLCVGHWKYQKTADVLFENYLQTKEKYKEAFNNNLFYLCESYQAILSEIQEELSRLWINTHQDLDVKSLHDGDVTTKHKAVMTITGKASEFAHLESIYLGILARGTRVATNTRRVCSATNKPIIFFADRFDRWSNQTADGYAAHIGGVLGVATNSMGKWWGEGGMGTTPHALIAMEGGDTAKAAELFGKYYPNEKNIPLVDFHNDCAFESIKVLQHCEEKNIPIWGVRLDTSETMIDDGVLQCMGQTSITGVCPALVNEVRRRLDSYNFQNIKIVVSGGFTADKIKLFEENNVPVDAYGVGSSLLQGNFDYTADIVKVDGIPMAKKGRSFNPDINLEDVHWNEIYNT